MFKLIFRIVGFCFIVQLGGILYSQNNGHYHYHYYRHGDHYHYYLHHNPHYHHRHNYQQYNHRHNHQYHNHNHGQNLANEHMRKHGFESLAGAFESPERAKWQKPDEVVRILGELSGKTVADLGAGTGYFTFRLVKKAKKVIALEPSEYFIQYIKNKREKLPKKYQKRLKTRLVSYDDPLLFPGEADIVLSVNVYHHIKNRIVYFRKVWDVLPKGGKLVIVDFKKDSSLSGGPPNHLKLPLNQVVEELSQAGFRSMRANTKILEHQYILIAKK